MLTGFVLLYVGAALLINGIWIIGQAKAAPAPAPAAGAAGRALARPEPLQGREIAVINLFAAGVGIVAAILLVTLGAIHGELGDVANAAFILLFAFTYLWIALNQLLKLRDHAFGWFCLFIAITAVPTAIYTLRGADGNPAAIWLGINWFVWAILWFLFFLMLTLERPIARLVGSVTIAVGIGTAWAFGYAILQGLIAL